MIFIHIHSNLPYPTGAKGHPSIQQHQEMAHGNVSWRGPIDVIGETMDWLCMSHLTSSPIYKFLSSSLFRNGNNLACKLLLLFVDIERAEEGSVGVHPRVESRPLFGGQRHLVVALF